MLNGKAVSACCLFSFLVVVLVLTGCDSGPGESLYEEGRSITEEDPQIESFEPAEKALAGVGPVTIFGQNFIPDTSITRVYFDGTRAEILEATETHLRVRPPDEPGDSVFVRVSVIGAEHLGKATYQLDPAVEPFGEFGPNETPWAIATDDANNVYVSLEANGSPAGIKQITSEGERSDYAPAQPWRYTDLKVGPDGALYAARGIPPILYRVPPGGGEAAVWQFGDGLGAVRALDVDAQGDVWAGGDNEAIYRVTPDNEVSAFDFTGDVRAMRLYDGMLYVAAIRDTASSIWRAPIDADNELGAFEEYFAFSEEYDAEGTGNYDVEGAAALALAFAQDGTMFVGTDAAASLVVVSPDGSAEPFYSGLFEPSIINLAWGDGPFLYATRAPPSTSSPLPQTMLRINTQKRGAD